MNVLTASGNLGKNAETRHTQSENTVTSFSVAMKSGYGQNEQTVWLDCSLWGKRGEALANHLVKGQQVVVSGELSTREYNGKTYLQLRCNDVTLVGGKPQGGQQQSKQQDPSGEFDDDIPW